jgi:hypothetical protein
VVTLSFPSLMRTVTLLCPVSWPANRRPGTITRRQRRAANPVERSGVSTGRHAARSRPRAVRRAAASARPVPPQPTEVDLATGDATPGHPRRPEPIRPAPAPIDVRTQPFPADGHVPDRIGAMAESVLSGACVVS